MGSDNSKLQLAVDNFYYTNGKLEGKILIDGQLLQKALYITIHFVCRFQIIFRDIYENVRLYFIQKPIKIEQQDRPFELHFSIDLDENLPPTAFIKNEKMQGEIEYQIEVIAYTGSMFGPAHIQKQIILRQALSEKVVPAEFEKKLHFGYFSNRDQFCLLKIKINKTEFFLGEMAEIILDLDNRHGLQNIDYFKITLIQTVNVKEKKKWLKEKQKLSSQAIKGIKKNEQSKQPQTINLPIIDNKGIFSSKFQTGLMTVDHHIEISAFDEEESQINLVSIPIVITQKESKCSYEKVNSINGIQSHIDLGKIYFDQRFLSTLFIKIISQSWYQK